MPMQWVLPGGAKLNGGDERAVACRPLAAVRERTVPAKGRCWLSLRSRLATAKLWIEVLAALVGLIGAVLALFGLLRK